MESYTLEEMEQKNIEKMKKNRDILDDLKSEYDKDKFTDYEIEENDDGYTLKKADLTYIFEGRNTNPFDYRLTVIQEGCKKISFKNSEVLEEFTDHEGYKTGIGEFFIRIEEASKQKKIKIQIQTNL